MSKVLPPQSNITNDQLIHGGAVIIDLITPLCDTKTFENVYMENGKIGYYCLECKTSAGKNKNCYNYSLEEDHTFICLIFKQGTSHECNICYESYDQYDCEYIDYKYDLIFDNNDEIERIKVYNLSGGNTDLLESIFKNLNYYV